MSYPLGASGLVVKAHRRFLDDTKKLPPPIQQKVRDVVRILREHGAYYGRLETRRLVKNPNPAFRLMDVDDSYRIVAAIEGQYVFLEKVGVHDPTERWGENATLKDYQDRIAVDPSMFGRAKKQAADKEDTAPLFDLGGPSLPQIAESVAVADVLTDALDGVLEGWADGTIEDWMVFLSPVQRRAVDRGVGGPARVTGGPGTGKTVVGLHRAAAFAKDLQPDQRILLTSFVNTVPAVLSGLLERLAPDVADRAEFHTVHSLAMKVLNEAGGFRVDEKGARSRFDRVLASKPERAKQLLQGARFTADYLWEEVTRVIEGRGITAKAEYLAVARVGRKRQMPALVRSLVWELYQDYRAACEQGDAVADWNWVLKLALDRVREGGPRQRYAAIVVDEAQDITEVGVRFLLELLEGGASGRLMLIGDSGQRIYPGGYRLSDLGLEIRGRSFPLTVCYRSTDEIMRAVGALGRYLSPEEFGDDGLRSLATSTVRFGPKPVLRTFANPVAETSWVISQLDPDDPTMDATAILAFTNNDVREWRRRLTDAGIGSVGLDEYKGRPLPGVKVGTYHRAKGLEFERIFLPGLNSTYPLGDRNDPDEIIEKGSLLYVAMSRARDRLVLSYTGEPSMYLEPVGPLCDTGVERTQ